MSEDQATPIADETAAAVEAEQAEESTETEAAQDDAAEE